MIGPAFGSITLRSWIPLASAARRTVSIASSTNSAGSMTCISRRNFPELTRLMSRSSSMSRICARALRSMISRPLARSAASLGPRRRTCVQPRMAESGVRNSCESVARKSSVSELSVLDIAPGTARVGEGASRAHGRPGRRDFAVGRGRGPAGSFVDIRSLSSVTQALPEGPAVLRAGHHVLQIECQVSNAPNH